MVILMINQEDSFLWFGTPAAKKNPLLEVFFYIMLLISLPGYSTHYVSLWVLFGFRLPFVLFFILNCQLFNAFACKMM